MVLDSPARTERTLVRSGGRLRGNDKNLLFLLYGASDSGLDELRKQGVRGKRTSKKLGMKLGTEEKGMDFARKLGDFHQNAVGRGAGKNHSALFYVGNVLWIYLVAVAVAFVN